MLGAAEHGAGGERPLVQRVGPVLDVSLPVEGMLCVGDVAGREDAGGAGLQVSSTTMPSSTAMPAEAASSVRCTAPTPTTTRSRSTRGRAWCAPLDRCRRLRRLDAGPEQHPTPWSVWRSGTSPRPRARVPVGAGRVERDRALTSRPELAGDAATSAPIQPPPTTRRPSRRCQPSRRGSASWRLRRYWAPASAAPVWSRRGAAPGGDQQPVVTNRSPLSSQRAAPRVQARPGRPRRRSMSWVA